ncbi:DUF2752 domain-containing protein [Mucilaginibacter litoreus]|uniref:DUF2752 domain-containing protein n=1 Tax=Mucilaginibacter litoreus TaxID=1048221 RepID=A0ABW3AXI6_9SPHI
MIKNWVNRYFELIFWIVALTCLAFTNPAGESHFSLCPLKALGISWCPGCGLGHAIAYLFHGNVKDSLQAHWLGIPVLLILLYRIYTLAFKRSIYRSY